MNKDELAAELNHTNVKAFSVVVRVGEGTADEEGYRRMFTGKLFTSFADHPRQIQSDKGSALRSDAAGAYQIMSYTWRDIQAALRLPDFSPRSQDIAFVWLVKERRKALEEIKAGKFQAAVKKCANEWASLPGSPYGQPVKTMAQAMKTYEQNGGTYFGTEGAATVPSYRADKLVLQKGNQGVDVAELQTLLINAGAMLTVDGRFGAETENAVKTLQREKNLLTDGVVGPYTWAALLTPTAR